MSEVEGKFLFNDGAGGYWQSAKGRSGGDGRKPKVAVQVVDGMAAKLVPVIVRRCRKGGTNASMKEKGAESKPQREKSRHSTYRLRTEPQDNWGQRRECGLCGTHGSRVKGTSGCVPGRKKTAGANFMCKGNRCATAVWRQVA
jgi:hypothetical protein